MQHAEVIYESGDKSVVAIDGSMEDFQAGLAEQHRRAMSGEDAGPAGGPASRIKSVVVYSEHPVDLHPSGVDVNRLQTLVEGMTKDNAVDPNQLVSAIRDEVSPLYPLDQGRHASLYKASGTEMPLDFLEGGSE